MRTKTDPTQTLFIRISLVRNWKSQKRVKMDGKQIKKCAKELGISSAAVKDCLNAIDTAKRRERGRQMTYTQIPSESTLDKQDNTNLSRKSPGICTLSKQICR